MPTTTSFSGFTRRRFIQTAAASTLAAPYIIPSSALGRGGRTAPSDRITMALVGCGGMGNANMNGFLGMEDVQFVAVCDPDRERREQSKKTVEDHYAKNAPAGEWAGCEAYNDFREVLTRDDVDAIIQATPDHWHGIVVTEAARQGKDIYGEKPLSLTIGQGRTMVDTVRRFARVFQTGSQQRSDARFQQAIELVRNGRIGRVHTVTCGLPTGPSCGVQPTVPVPEGFDYDLWLGPAPRAPYCERRTHWDFRWILDYSGGQVTDWGAHHIDIAHLGLGLELTGPVEVEGVGEFPREGLFDAATNYRFTAAYDTGVRITCTNNVENGVKWEGEDGWVFVSRGRIDAEPKSLLDERIGPDEFTMRRRSGHVGHRREFINCVRSRRDPIAPIDQAHRTITVAHLGNIAMTLERKVRWNPDTEEFIDDPAATRLRDRALREPWRL